MINSSLTPFVLNLALQGVELVILSACSSGVGRSSRSAGLEGLVWAFLQADAGQVIASRYPVDDESTARFMQALYQQLLEHPVDRAL